MTAKAAKARRIDTRAPSLYDGLTRSMPEAAARVLVIDDDASFCGMVAEVLSDKGYDAVAAADPSDALQRVSDGLFEVAVVDLLMPEMGGLELAQRIRAQSPDTQVVILTGHGQLDSAIEGIQLGIFDYIQKEQVRIARLERSVRKAAERSRLLRENRELVSRLEESNRALTGLQRVGASLAGEPHLDRLLSLLVASAREACGAAAGRAFLLGRTHSGELVIESSSGDGADSIHGARLQAAEGIATLALEKDETLLVEEPKGHPRYSHRCDEMPTALPGLLCAPLRHGSVQGVLMVAGRERGAFGSQERETLDGLARLAAVAIDNAFNHERSINFFTHTSEILVSFLESMDIFYPGHSRGVAALCDMVTRRLGMDESERRDVHFAALLHDIGKVRLDPAVLRSEETSAEAKRLIEQHTLLGPEILRPITAWEGILPIIHSHHERWDGKGYPRGLRGEEIPVGARVVAVADAFDAMTRSTPYARGRIPAEALAEIAAHTGTQFEPRIARLFVAEYKQQGDPR